MAFDFESGALLRTLDPQTGATLGSVPITLSGETILGGTGLAADSEGTLFALLKLSSQSGRELVTIDPATGVATSIGDTGDKFAGLAFDSNDTLFGVTGDGAVTSESLFTIDTGNASTTLATALGNGNDAEAIGFNPQDGLLYHASGLVLRFADGSERVLYTDGGALEDDLEAGSSTPRPGGRVGPRWSSRASRRTAAR